jgi:hypothetical protein
MKKTISPKEEAVLINRISYQITFVCQVCSYHFSNRLPHKEAVASCEDVSHFRAAIHFSPNLIKALNGNLTEATHGVNKFVSAFVCSDKAGKPP